MSAEASRDNRVTIWAVVPAAGSGSRMQATLPKQYLQLAGKPVIEHALSALYAVPRIAGVVVGVVEEDTVWVAVAGCFVCRRFD